MEMGVSLPRRRQSPGRGFWEGGRAKRANERQVTWGRTPVLRKRRNRRRLPCQPAPPPRPNREDKDVKPGVCKQCISADLTFTFSDSEMRWQGLCNSCGTITLA